MYPTRREVELLKKEYPSGTRVRLVSMNDMQAPPVGTYGAVRCVDDVGTIHVRWDGGSSLGIVFQEDVIEKVM